MRKNIFFILFFVIIIKIVIADKPKKQISLDETIVGKIDKDLSFNFYELNLPNQIKKDSLLVFTCRENKIIKENEEMFSDPDIFVSKEPINPKQRKKCDWYSETFGNDIITIPGSELQKLKKLYVSLFCEKKCRYNLKAYLTKEIEFFLGQVNTIKLLKHSSINYFLKIKNDNYQQLKVVAYSPEQKHFHILMTKNQTTPSTKNTIQATPCWMGGYMINIDKNSENFCSNCVYHLLFQTEEESTTIKFYAFFQNTFTQIYSLEPIMDSIETNITRCYTFEMKKNIFAEDDKLIIQMTLFGGEAFLHITGWNKDLYNDVKNIKKFENYGYNIITEKSIMISKKDIDYYNKEYNEGIEGQKGKLHFCIYGIQKGSYILGVNYLNDAVSLQKYNYLFPGHEKNGFLSENQVTSYKIMDNNMNKNSNITINLKNIQGRAQLYGYFCDSKTDIYCSFGEYRLNQKIESKEILLTRQTYSSSVIDNSLFIEKKDNKCYSDTSSKDCKLLAIVKCLIPDNKICSFSLSLTISDIPILMTPRKTYFNYISTGKKDIYGIFIIEKNIKSFVVVLTTNIGDAEFSIIKKNDKNKDSKDEGKLIAISSNDYNLPDVIRVTPKMINAKNLVGEYIITVSCKYYSSYNLYYYTTKPKSKKRSITSKDITTTLSEGYIITDYFPNNLDFKIYCYTPGDKTAKDIKITLTKVNVRFTFYVFLSLKDIKFNDNIVSVYDERFSGYKWISDSNNEVTISKKDKNYKKRSNYYIVVLRDYTTDIDSQEEEKKDDYLLMMYYLGVTKEGLPFYLHESIEHSVTLNSNYRYQNYIYTHYNYSQPFQLLVNILNGQVDLFISNKELQLNDLNEIYKNFVIINVTSLNNRINYNFSTVYVSTGISDYASITSNDLNEMIYFNKDKKNVLYIYIYQSRLSLKYGRDSQFLISGKTNINKGIYLSSGHVYKNKILSDKEEHFIIEEVKHRDSLTITARFNKGIGDIYAKLLDNNDEIKLKQLTFPNSTYFDYKGNSIYMGKVIQIPGNIFDKIGKTIIKVKILITITARTTIRSIDKEVEYYLSYSDEAKRINQNIPYQSSINAGEFQYYTFYFDKNTENILISLSNMDGDADLFLNYGNEIYPTPLECDWLSNSIGHEYIDINKNDEYFVKNNINNLSGYYTLLVIGYTNTTYTLFVSSHDEKVFRLVDNIATNCKCEAKGDKCYFRYDNVLNKRNLQNKNNIKSNEIIFTSQYLYGNGKMYASILKEQEIYTNEDNKKYIDYFPSEESNDVNNAKFGKRNYLKVKVPEKKYSIDSLILLTIVCEEKTDVEITAAPLIPSGDYKYLSTERENIFYLKYNESLPQKQQPETILAYYSYRDTDSIYEFHAYLGKAKIHIYTNESKWDNVTRQFYHEYNHISEFVIQSKSDQNELKEYRYQKYFTEEYFNTISANFCKGKTVLFSILPLSNFGFYIQIINDRTWINVPIGKDKNYYVKNRVLYGYFDIFEEFSSVEVSIYLKEYISKKAVIYLKLVVDTKMKKSSEVIDNNNDKDKLKHYEIPGSDNYDYTANTDNYLGAMNINIDNIPVIKNELKNIKIVRALFVIHIYNKHVLYGQEKSKGIIAPENEAQISPYSNRFDYDFNKINTISILVTPGVNNFKRIDTVPYTYYFSNTSLISNSNKDSSNSKIYNGNKEIKIYSLDKITDQDNKMIIQINTCAGDYDIKISSKVVNYDDNSNDISYTQLSSSYGRKIFLLDKLKHKHIYVSIKSKQIEDECNQGLKKDSNNVTCSKELSYLLHYYSATNKQYSSSEPSRIISYKSGNNDKQIILVLPKLKEFDYHKNYIEKKNIEYNLFWTYNRTYFKYFESICYLGHFMEDTEDKNEKEIFLQKNIQLNEKNEYLMNNVDPKKPLYVNVLARNIKTNELILFKPIRGMTRPSKTAIVFSSVIIVIMLCLIMYISWHYYNEEGLSGYQLTNSNDVRRDEIKYTNLSLGPV